MRGALVSGGSVLLVSCSLLWAADFARAESAPHNGTKKYIATIHREGLEEEKIFDVSRSSEAEELTTLLRAGAVESLEKEKEVNILAITWELGLWTLVVFVLLLLLLRRWAWKPMLEMAQRREGRIREALAQAQRARADAERLRAELQNEMNGAQEKVRGILDAARRDSERTTEEMIARARAEIQTERERLHREMERARDQALQELWSQAAHLATLISAKALRRQLTVDDHSRLVDEAIADLRHAGKERQREVAGVQS